MEQPLKMEILEEDDVTEFVSELAEGGEAELLTWSTVATPPAGAYHQRNNPLKDGIFSNPPNIQYVHSMVQPLNVLVPQRQPQFSKPKLENYLGHAMSVSSLGSVCQTFRPKTAISYQDPTQQTPKSWRPRVEDCHGGVMSASSFGPPQKQQCARTRVEDYQRAPMPFGSLGPLKQQFLMPKTENCTPIDMPCQKEPMKMPVSPMPTPKATARQDANMAHNSRNFWKAGEYDGQAADPSASSNDMDHVRVHPKFLHSNATSHKWAIGALAELLDNAMDEVNNGATFVNIDILVNKRDGSRMLLVEDDGGGMDPNRLRQCMSLGFSVKRKLTNTIGQYGNGFKTSTMRLGADVIVFSRSAGKEGKSCPTESIGLLSYTFLTKTGKEDIIVPMIDYQREDGSEAWNKLTRSSASAWDGNLETILQWSPYSTEDDLLQQFSSMKEQGTRVVIYNLWEDDQGALELDFDRDSSDIQVRGANRDEKKIQMAEKFPNSRHFLTYAHSLRSYASILYLRIPQGFRMILRGREIEHHNIVDDLMLKEELTYRSAAQPDAVASVLIGFVKDAKDHIDVQGFNVYHKNRLIKPFWRVWTAAGSGGRGVIGVLEADFVEPAHDKQGFERTTVLYRLETWLKYVQRRFWGKNSEKIGYGRPKKLFIENGLVGSGPSTESLRTAPCHSSSQLKLSGVENDANGISNGNSGVHYQVLKIEISRLKSREENLQRELQRERERNRALVEQLEAAHRKLEERNKKLEYSNYRVAEKKHQKEKEVEYLGNQLTTANGTINMLLQKIYHKSKVSVKQEQQ